MSNTSAQEKLMSKINERTAKVAVIGMGYVGLPLASVFAEAGFNVTGIDVDQRKMDLLNQGKSYIVDIPDHVVENLVSAGKLRGTSDFQYLSEVDAVSICVPTPLRKTGDPDLSFIASATENLAPYVHPGMVIVLESSTYPGTTREMMLSRFTEISGLEVGKDFFLAFSPERVDPGRKDWTTKNTPKVVGGITSACSDVASCWYLQALDRVVRVSSTEVAEMTKLLENTFRMVNISLVNELAMMCDRLGVDVWEVIDAAATKPFGFMKFTPGPGVGGHCIPIDPLYLSWKLRSLNYTARFIELASEIDAMMPHFVLGKVTDALNSYEKSLKGSKVLVIGVAYKPDIDDLRESPALDLIYLLEGKGAKVNYHDPHIPSIYLEDSRKEMKSVSDFWSEVENSDCVVIVTNHKVYDYSTIFTKARCIVDTRNALGFLKISDPKVFKL